MKNENILGRSRALFLTAGIWIMLLFFHPGAQAQCSTTTQGFNALYGCKNVHGQVFVQGGFAMVDATQFASGSDICAATHSIFAIYNPNNHYAGVVVDARGFRGTGLTCGSNPWDPSFGWTTSFSSVVLLPADTIMLSAKLVLPQHTKLIGTGSGSTILVAASNFSGTEMIDMGSSTICPVASNHPDCPGVQIEHLGLNANNQSFNGTAISGIVNCCSQELSFTNDVAISNVAAGGIGLSLQGRSNNSGPYVNIHYSGAGACIQIYDSTGIGPLNQTRGIHGLTCNMSNNSGAAVYIDAPNNSLEDVAIQGGSSQDGIRIGSQGAAYNNVLFNVSGSGLNNVVHIVKGANTVSDVTMMGVSQSGGTNSILDELTASTLTDANVGMYILGEQVQAAGTNVGYSRFTTSPNAGSNDSGAVTWLVGSSPPSGGTCAAGSLYSCTNGSNCMLDTLYGCEGSSGWKGIK